MSVVAWDEREARIPGPVTIVISPGFGFASTQATQSGYGIVTSPLLRPNAPCC